MNEWLDGPNELLKAVQECAPTFPMDDPASLVLVGEVAVALEILCDNLYELDVQLSDAVMSRLVITCQEWAVPENYWRRHDIRSRSRTSSSDEPSHH